MNVSHIVALVLFNSSGFKGVRIPNTLFAFELGASALLLAAGGYSSRSRGAV